MSKETIKAPKHLKPATRRWFEEIAAEFELEAHHVKLLTLAAESWDRCQGARELLDKSGVSYTDRFGCPRSRPEVAVERDSRLAFARLVRELGLDVAPEPGRVPRLSPTGPAKKGGA
ncbi:MAG: hypothetical protein J5J06_02925 [Phycisphaerae bacterium]|nr:hypothetical protein [Phycisphaerae bacterium]